MSERSGDGKRPVARGVPLNPTLNELLVGAHERDNLDDLQFSLLTEEYQRDCGVKARPRGRGIERNGGGGSTAVPPQV